MKAMECNMSATKSILNYLSKGNQLTTRAARTMFKINNIANAVYVLRNEGHVIYTKRVTLSDGRQVFAYRMGEPSRAYTQSMKSRHVARARQTLYRDAITA
jgi:hypothetical protein